MNADFPPEDDPRALEQREQAIREALASSRPGWDASAWRRAVVEQLLHSFETSGLLELVRPWFPESPVDHQLHERQLMQAIGVFAEGSEFVYRVTFLLAVLRGEPTIITASKEALGLPALPERLFEGPFVAL
jgi:hypothetical protein